MKDVSDEEEETYVPPAPADMEIVNKSRKERKETEENLRKMMESDDEVDEEEVKEVKAVQEEEDLEMVEPKVKEASVEKEVPPVVSGGRRRGRRRVMKKKTVKDEEGYLGKCCSLSFRSLLTRISHEGGACLGIVLRGRTSSAAKT